MLMGFGVILLSIEFSVVVPAANFLPVILLWKNCIWGNSLNSLLGTLSVGIGKSLISDKPSKIIGRLFKSFSVISDTQDYLYLFKLIF